MYLYLFVNMYWITESPVVEGKVEVDTGTCIVRLSHPAKAKCMFRQMGRTP